MKKNITFSIYLLSILCISFDSQGQQNENERLEEATLIVTPAIGLSWRSSIIDLFNSRGMVRFFRIPYNYEKNIQGISLNPSINIFIRPARIAIEYAPNLRYDHLYNVWSDSCHLIQSESGSRPMCYYPLLEEVNDFIVDHNFNLFVRLGENKDKRKTRIGFGLSIVNSGKDFTSQNGQNYWNLSFATYNLALQIPIKKHFIVEPKVLYIPREFPYNPMRRYLSFSLRTFYTFNSFYL
jgi:hypothetical protein